VPADQSTQTSGPPMRPGTLRPVGRRRPSGEPPPLPYHLQTSGVGWLLAAVVLVALAIVVFGRGIRGPAVAVTVADDTVVRWLAGLHAPGLVVAWRALAALSSWWFINGLSLVLVLALLALRRFRHLVVFLIFASVVVLPAANIVGEFAHRPRPFAVAIQTSWGGWALPSLQVTFFATVLVAILYTLVPEGRWRNTGKWVAAALVALTALGRIALGADAPTDVLVAAAIGVTIPLLAFRVFTPSEAFPITYRRGRSAHLDVGGARGAAIRRGLKDQLDLVVQEIKPFGMAGSAG
jgi:membrane-associated phospholipid phosphatase